MADLFLLGGSPARAAETSLAAGGDLDGNYPNPDVVSIANVTDAAMDLALVSSAATWANPYRDDDQSVSASTVLVDDDTLSFAIAANEVWRVEASIPLTCHAVGGYSGAITGPAGAAAPVFAAMIGPAYAYALITTLGATYSFQPGTSGIVTVRAVVTNGATPGTVKVRFAQFSSEATATVHKAGAFLAAWRMA